MKLPIRKPLRPMKRQRRPLVRQLGRALRWLLTNGGRSVLYISVHAIFSADQCSPGDSASSTQTAQAQALAVWPVRIRKSGEAVVWFGG